MMIRPPNTALCMFVVRREGLSSRTIARLKVPLRWYRNAEDRWRPERLRWYPWDEIEGGRLFPYDRMETFPNIGAWLLRDSPQHREVCSVLAAAGQPAPTEWKSIGPLRRTHFGAVYQLPDETVVTTDLVQERGAFVDLDQSWPSEASMSLYRQVASCTDREPSRNEPSPATFDRFAVECRVGAWEAEDAHHKTLEAAITRARKLYADFLCARSVRVVDTGTGVVLMRRAMQRGKNPTREETPEG